MTEILLLILTTTVLYVGTIFIKLLFLLANLKVSVPLDVHFLVIPFSTLNAENFLKKSQLRYNVSRAKLFIIELLGIIYFLLLGLSVYSMMEKGLISIPETIFISLLQLYIVLTFSYFSITDIISLKIKYSNVRKFMFSIVIISISILTVRLYSTIYLDIDTTKYLTMGNFDNILASVLLSLFVFVIYRLNKGIGFVEIPIFASIGLILGLPLSIIFLLFTSILGGIYSVLYLIKVRSFTNQTVPFMPIVTMSYLLVLLFGQTLIDKFIIF